MFGQLLRTSVPKMRSTVSTLFSMGSNYSKNFTFFGRNPSTLQVNPVRGYKVHSSLKKRCEHCFFVHRRKRLFVICKENPKHKQRQG